jgi:hypothetical protein
MDNFASAGSYEANVIGWRPSGKKQQGYLSGGCIIISVTTSAQKQSQHRRMIEYMMIVLRRRGSSFAGRQAINGIGQKRMAR